MTKYIDLPVGEIITDFLGIEWKRTNHRDFGSTHEDNYYYMPIDCYCNVEVGGGYTYSDEYGCCDFCEGYIRQINGHNDEVRANFDDKVLFDKTKEVNVYLDDRTYEYRFKTHKKNTVV